MRGGYGREGRVRREERCKGGRDGEKEGRGRERSEGNGRKWSRGEKE